MDTGNRAAASDAGCRQLSSQRKCPAVNAAGQFGRKGSIVGRENRILKIDSGGKAADSPAIAPRPEISLPQEWVGRQLYPLLTSKLAPPALEQGQ